MKSRSGFTVLEIIIVAVFAGLLLILFFVQKGNIDAMERDEDRKIAINAMYYALEEGYYEENKAYPENIEKSDDLPWIDPNLFTDPYGMNVWDNGSNYSYEASDCTDGKCKSYTLRTTLEKEEDYVKTSRH